MTRRQEIIFFKGIFFVIALFIFISLPSSTHAVDPNIESLGTSLHPESQLLTGGQTDVTGTQSCTVPPKNFSELMCVVTYSILSPLIPILVTLALIAFFWGVTKYAIKGADDEKEREQGKQIMIWGIIGLFVIVSVWGLVAVVQNTFNLGNASFKSSNVKLPGR
ncbi:MAG: hypothetical protein HZC04_01455 [Candidatus Lloydbacteria bacterium]|nr:hypothetical protein [Candidatus Lloydbacteria bacterium]